MVMVITRRDLTKIRRNQTTLVKNASLPFSQTRLSWNVHGSRAKNTLFNESFEIYRKQRKHQRRIWPIPTEPGTSLRSRVEIITRGKKSAPIFAVTQKMPWEVGFNLGGEQNLPGPWIVLGQFAHMKPQYKTMDLHLISQGHAWRVGTFHTWD